ncbi:hypothetical protein ABXV23_18590 [Vibrio owensii]|uniref:hypothetical protein n=1 Tax=Vibrio owensii TaxID=696485 RepID=UPI003392FBFC
MIKTADSSAVFLLEEKNTALGDSGVLRFINREEAIERDPALKGVDGICPYKDKISSLLASRFSLLASRFSLLASRFSLLASRFSLLASPENKKGRYLSISLCFKPNYF